MEIAKYKSDIYDKRYKLFSDMNSDETTLIKDTMRYVTMYEDKLCKNLRFFKNQSRFESLIRDYHKRVEREIEKYISELVEKQQKEIDEKITKLINSAPEMTPDQINSEIYLFQREITQITKEKLNVIDGFIEDNIKEMFENYNSEIKDKLNSTEIDKFVKFYCEGIGNNMSSEKNKYFNMTNRQIENYYDYAGSILKDAKKVEEPEQLNETKGVGNNSDAFLNSVEANKDKPDNKVKVSDIKQDVASLEVIEKYLKSFDSGITISQIDGYLTINVPGMNSTNVHIKQDGNKQFIYVSPSPSVTDTIFAIELDGDTQTLGIKKMEQSKDKSFIAYSSQKNELTAIANDGMYVFNFENGLTKAYTFNDKGEKMEIPASELQTIIEKLKSEGLNIEDQIRYSAEQSKTIESEETEKVEESMQRS